MTLIKFGSLMAAVLVGISRAVRVGESNIELASDGVLTSEECTEKKMRGVCVCGKYSKKRGGYQCTKCLQQNKWGYGCDLECPDCSGGCDLSGNCIFDPKAIDISHCKRNSRVAKPGDAKDVNVILNQRGECAACESGWAGLQCKEECPKGCADSAEGFCTRGGECYACKLGYYGSKCDMECPSACPKCLMEDNTVTDDEGNEETLPAGTCDEPCRSNTWGKDCKDKCPTNCAKIKKKAAFCTRDKGQCLKCLDGFHGKDCMDKCSANCKDKTCLQLDEAHRLAGTCLNGCNNGFWGTHCDKQCPEFSVLAKGCDRITGFPVECDAKHFPYRGAGGLGICQSCPKECKGQTCNADGTCNAGCNEGFYGAKCDTSCPGDCVGGCDVISGQCNACPDTLTGKFCDKKCHTQCNTCKQFGAGGLLTMAAKPGNMDTDCLTCRNSDPATFDGSTGTCKCIEGAGRDSATGLCKCNNPEGPDALKWEGYFDVQARTCRTNCKSKYTDAKGKVQALQKVIGKGQRTDCIPIKAYNGFVIAFASAEGEDDSAKFQDLVAKTTDGCTDGKLGMKDASDVVVCVYPDQVKYILGLAE